MVKRIKRNSNKFVVILACIVAIAPYILMGISACNTSLDIRRGSIFSGISVAAFAENFSNLVFRTDFVKVFLNSLIVSIASTLIGLFASSLAGYAYVIYKTRISEKLFYISFFSILVPSSITIIPLFMILQHLHMLDSLASVILISLSLPFLIYLFRQNTKLFPAELIKSARIDGLSGFLIFWKVYIPNMKSVIITAGLILFIDSWNGFLGPLVIIQSQRKMTLTLYLNSMGSSLSSDYGVFMLALLLSTMPICIIFLIAQKYFNMGMKGL